MISAGEILDLKKIAEFMSDPFVIRHQGDLSEPPEPNNAVRYVAVNKDGVIACIVIVILLNDALADIHLCTKKYLSGHGVSAVKCAIDYIFNNFTVNCIAGNIPSKNKLCIKTAIDCKMIRLGVLPSAFSMNGKLDDLEIFYIERKSWGLHKKH